MLRLLGWPARFQQLLAVTIALEMGRGITEKQMREQ